MCTATTVPCDAHIHTHTHTHAHAHRHFHLLQRTHILLCKHIHTHAHVCNKLTFIHIRTCLQYAHMAHTHVRTPRQVLEDRARHVKAVQEGCAVKASEPWLDLTDASGRFWYNFR